jgi:hypothetical protein
MACERCKACGMPKPPLAMEQDDDFCSTDCAGRYYGQSREDQMFPFLGRQADSFPIRLANGLLCGRARPTDLGRSSTHDRRSWSEP